MITVRNANAVSDAEEECETLAVQLGIDPSEVRRFWRGKEKGLDAWLTIHIKYPTFDRLGARERGEKPHAPISVKFEVVGVGYSTKWRKFNLKDGKLDEVRAKAAIELLRQEYLNGVKRTTEIKTQREADERVKKSLIDTVGEGGDEIYSVHNGRVGLHFNNLKPEEAVELLMLMKEMKADRNAGE